MPSKKKKYNSRFPPARIKKIMQSDDEVGKVAAVVPIIISRVLEIFVENLLKESSKITRQRNARTLTPAHIKASILQNSQLDFLKEIVSLVPDIHQSGDDEQVTYHPTVNYANHYSIPSANHHLHPQQLIRQQQTSPIFIKNIHNISNTQTSSSISKITVKKVTTNNDNQNILNDDSKISTATSSFLLSCNKRFKNTYNRSNSAPCTTSTIKENLNKNELANEQAEDEEDDDAFDDEDEDSSYSDSSSSKQNKNNFNDNNELPCSSVESCNTKNVLDQLESCKVTKNEVENEDDDYDA